MRLRNSSHSYGAVTITLHWLGAISVIVMLASGLMMFLAPNREIGRASCRERVFKDV